MTELRVTVGIGPYEGVPSFVRAAISRPQGVERERFVQGSLFCQISGGW